MMTLNSIIEKLMRTTTGRETDRYWELEGLCKIETMPQIVASNPFGGPVMVATPRRYCVKR